jgi:hypothetical protein
MAGRPIAVPARSHRRPCLDAEALSRFLDGKLPRNDWARALAHVTLCDRCYRRCTRDPRWWIQRPSP